MPKRQPLSKNGLRLLALIAFRDGEITEERCCEIIGCSRNEVRDEMHKRCGKFNPYTETCNELESANRELERLRAEVERLKAALAQLVATLEAHEVSSLSCDRDGETYCCCVHDETSKARKALDAKGGG